MRGGMIGEIYMPPNKYMNAYRCIYNGGHLLNRNCYINTQTFRSLFANFLKNSPLSIMRYDGKWVNA